MALTRTNHLEMEIGGTWPDDDTYNDTVAYNHNATGSNQLLILYIWAFEPITLNTLTYGGVTASSILFDTNDSNYYWEQGLPGRKLAPACLIWNNPPTGTNNFYMEYSPEPNHSVVIQAQSFTDAAIGNVIKHFNLPGVYTINMFVNEGSMIYALGMQHDYTNGSFRELDLDGTTYANYEPYDPYELWITSDANILWGILSDVKTEGVKSVSTLYASRPANDFITIEINDVTIPDRIPYFNIGKLFIGID